jgi:broad specificity phosphatase PhoE
MKKTVMPRTLTCVRHGESESNAAKRAAEKGNAHPREAELMVAHTSRRRLTARGVRQAQKARAWLHGYFQEEARVAGKEPFENVRGFFSPYARAMETAGYLGLPIVWLPDARLCERNWGELDQLPYEDRVRKYGEAMNFRELHGMFWPAANGETLHALSTRMWQHFYKLRNEHSDHDVVEVDHGETMLTKRFMLERWLPEDVAHMMIATDTKLSKEVLGKETDFQNKIINCRIIQYTRQREDGSWGDSYQRVRLIAPSALDDPKMNLDWRPIVRRKFTSEQLLAYVEQFPRYLEENA